MTRTRMLCWLVIGTLVLASPSLRADVRTDEKSHVEFAGALGRVINFFAGKASREGILSTVALKGDRMATIGEDTGRIVDLSEEKVYELDMKKKTYSMTTFAELRRKMEEARQKAEKEASKEQGQQKGQTASEEKPQESNVEVDFTIKNTGQKKTINGYDTHEAIMTIAVREKGKTLEQSGGLVLTSDMWLGPTVPQMRELVEFNRRFAEKLYGPMIAGASPDQMAAAMAMYPMMKPALDRMRAEGSKISGTPILTTTTMDAVKSADEVAAEQKERASDDKASPAGGVGGLLGGFAKRAMKKKMAGGDEVKPRATFLTTTTEVLKITPEVTAADVAIPAGFKQK